jgi:putative ABC transport system substrate-binding protein
MTPAAAGSLGALRALRLAVAIVALVPAFAARPQGVVAPPRVAVVISTSALAAAERLAAFRAGLSELGYAEGRNVAIDTHAWYAESRPLSELAAELVRQKPAAIVAEGNPAVLALKSATTTVPIVMSVVADPVGSGYVASLARPGGNVTGLSNTAEQLSGKRLEMLRELVPSLKRLAVLRSPTNRTHAILLRETESEARSMDMTPVAFDLSGENNLEGTFGAMARDRVQALVVLPQPLGMALRAPIAELALRHGLPTMFATPENVEAGGLASYGPNHVALWGRAATYVDRILKGAHPADLPIEQPTRIDFVLNLKTARALGLTVPRSLLLRVTRVIE